MDKLMNVLLSRRSDWGECSWSMCPSWIGSSGAPNSVSLCVAVSAPPVLSDGIVVAGAKDVTEAVDDAAADIPVVGVVLDCGVVVVLLSVGATEDVVVITPAPVVGATFELKSCECAVGCSRCEDDMVVCELDRKIASSESARVRYKPDDWASITS